MDVSHKTYYHLQRINEININWKVGDSLSFKSPQSNFYYQGLTKEVTEIQTNYNLPTHLVTDLENGLIEGLKNSSLQNQLEELLELISCDSDKNKIVQHFQEIVYEHVRKQNFKHLPSRHHCIWVVPRLDELKEWEEILLSRRTRTLELNLNGCIHRTSGILIDTTKNRKLSAAFENAVKYWNSEFTNTQEIEYLFEGTATITREILDA